MKSHPVFTLLALAAVALLPGFTLSATPLRVGMMPAVNSIPLIVAEAEGFFTAEGITVELEMFHNQLYRETALQTGQIDGSISDLINAVNAAAGGFPVQVTSITDGLFGLVTSPRSRIRSIADWKAARSVQVGLLQDSIIFYSAERMLQAHGADPQTIVPISTLQVPTRMEMVVAGQIEAAMLPEPMTQVAVARGAHLITDSSVMEQTPGVLLFTPQAVSTRSDQIRAFYRAYNRAVTAVNANPDSYRQRIVEAGGFPPAVRDTMIIPRFQTARVPSEAEFDDVVGWMREKRLIDAPATGSASNPAANPRISYRAVVNNSMLGR